MNDDEMESFSQFLFWAVLIPVVTVLSAGALFGVARIVGWLL